MARYTYLLLLLTALLALFTPSLAKLTAEQKQHFKDAMVAADKEIHFIKESEVDAVTKEDGVKFVFFGAQWCRYTQAFTPKWLEVQKQVAADKEHFGSVLLAKVDCTETYKDTSSLCHKTYQKYEGFPTTLVYVDGVPKGEYPDEDDAAKLLKYIKHVLSTYKPRVAKVEAKPATAAPAPAPAAEAPAPVVEDKSAPTPQAKQPVNFKAEHVPEQVNSESTPQPTESDSTSTVAPVLVLILVAAAVVLAVTKYRAAQNKKKGFPVSTSRYDGFSSHRESLLLWDAGNAIDKVA